MPKLWRETIEEHHRSVDDAILDTAWALVTEHGPMAVTMSAVAERTGIGRATLYKHFPDVGAVLAACHRRQVRAHLAHLAELRSRGADPEERLRAVLAGYAVICHHRGQHATGEIAAALHRGADVARAEQQLRELFVDLLAEVAVTGRLRDDVATDELATYCLHALGAAGDLQSEAAVHRLVAVTLAGLRPG